MSRFTPMIYLFSSIQCSTGSRFSSPLRILDNLCMEITHEMLTIHRQHTFSTLRPRQNARHFPDDTFKWIFLNENVWISIEVSLKFVPKGPINNIPALVQIMAWRRPGDKLLSEPIMVSLLTHICVTRPQWVIKNCSWNNRCPPIELFRSKHMVIMPRCSSIISKTDKPHINECFTFKHEFREAFGFDAAH